ncbi:hypothetical protein LSAT2_032114 [Lamellibrachia satsuma]|nr:hypothetical protein LSAT2_032114 [Lamellibrachia satsuma]
MSDGLVCLLAVLVIVCVFSPDPTVSQCTTKSCDNGDNEANVMTLVSRMQQQLAEQTETIISMKQDVAQLEKEKIRDHRSIEQLQQELAEQREMTGQIQREITETQNASCSTSCQRAAQDCTDLLQEGNTRSGVYYIHVPGTETATPVYCDMETDGGGWLVFQRRRDASIDFYRDWNAYKRGFGDFSNNFWLGNEYIHALTSNRQYELRVDLEDFEDESRYAAYSTFAVSSEADKYKFILGTYNGTAGSERRLRWLGHVCRVEDGRIPKDIFYSELKIGSRPTGRPMLRFKDVCRRDMKACNSNTTSRETTIVERGILRVRVREGVKASEEKRNTTWMERRQQRKDRENHAPVLASAYVCRIWDSLRHHANTGFSTKDRDNDRTNTTHCALTLKGGWWYGSCTGTNMNGVYHKGSKSLETGLVVVVRVVVGLVVVGLVVVGLVVVGLLHNGVLYRLRHSLYCSQIYNRTSSTRRLPWQSMRLEKRAFSGFEESTELNSSSAPRG